MGPSRIYQVPNPSNLSRCGGIRSVGSGSLMNHGFGVITIGSLKSLNEAAHVFAHKFAHIES